MNPLTDKRAIGVFSSYQATEQALRELQNSGFPMDRVSVVGQDSDRLNESVKLGDEQDHEDSDGHHADDGIKTGAVSGGAVGGLTGLLVGLGTLAIPGVGPILLAGALATTLATTAAGGAIGAAAGGLIGGLIGLGIPEDQAKVYNQQVSKGSYLMIVDGSNQEIAHAETILRTQGIQEWDIYPYPNQSSDDDYAALPNAPRTAQGRL
jgi:hypothetical protein